MKSDLSFFGAPDIEGMIGCLSELDKMRKLLDSDYHDEFVLAADEDELLIAFLPDDPMDHDMLIRIIELVENTTREKLKNLGVEL